MSKKHPKKRFQAYFSCQPFNTEKKWIGGIYESLDECRKATKENNLDWSNIFIAELKENTIERIEEKNGRIHSTK
jgi:hypothetical protein